MPTLRELEARFIRHEKGIAHSGHGRTMPDGTTQWGGFEVETMRTVGSLAEAHSIFFGCPACYATKGNTMVGVHHVLVTFEGRDLPPEYGSHDSTGAPSRWQITGGTGFDDLQLSPSIFLKDCPPCNWHGFIGSSGVPPGHAA